MPERAARSDPSPRVAAYLAPLPGGAASHPACLAKAALLRRTLAERPLRRVAADALPAPVRALVTCPPLDGEWIPDVHLVCVLFAIADAEGMSDDDYLGWLADMNTRMFRSIFAHLMTVERPEEMLARVPERWGVFHRGSALSVTGIGAGRAEVVLAFPPSLFHGLALRQFAPVWESALRLSEPSARVALVASDERSGRFVATWRG